MKKPSPAAHRFPARTMLAAPVIAALFIALTGFFVPAGAAGPRTGTAGTGAALADLEIFVSDPIFADEQAVISGYVFGPTLEDPAPTGTVSLFRAEGGPAIAGQELFELSYSFTVPPRPLGTTTLYRIQYSGDSNYAPVSAEVPVEVVAGPATVTTLTADTASPSGFGEPVSFTVHVAAPEGPLTGRPQGLVRLVENGVELGATGTDENWSAVITLDNLASGTHSITAEFFIAIDYEDSVSAPFTHTVLAGPAAIRTEFHSSGHGTIQRDLPVKVQAVVAPRAAGGPALTGWVQFYDWNTKVGAPVRLVKGKAGFTYTSLKPGKHVLQAKYLGSKDYAGGFTPARTVTVRR